MGTICLYANASAVFTEVDISTRTQHARSPMGVSKPATYKYAVTGNGQV